MSCYDYRYEDVLHAFQGRREKVHQKIAGDARHTFHAVTADAGLRCFMIQIVHHLFKHLQRTFL